MVAKLLPLIPEHRTYVEPYGGGASLLVAKEPSPIEVYNDLHEGVVTLFRVLRDEDKARELKRLLELTPYSRKELELAIWETEQDEVEKARKFFVCQRQSFAGRGRDAKWGYVITESYRGMAGTISKWETSIDALEAVSTRFRRVQIECRPALDVIKRFDTPETFFYLDPPYVAETRRDGGYTHEMDLTDHEELVSVLLGLQGKALLSGYDHEVYAPLVDAGWDKKEWETSCYAAGRTKATGIQGKGAATRMQKRTEVVWANYPLERQMEI